MTKILCVDDDPNVLSGYQRGLRRYQIEIAIGAEDAIEAVANHGPYAVVVSDMRMPRMNGIELLARIREISPDTVRMMLTGNSDQRTALDAVNEGHIFRFMTKPCPCEDLAKALDAGLAQYRLIVAERELLAKTLSGSVKMLTDILSLVSPAAFGRSSRVRSVARQIAQELGEPDLWMIEIAAMLSQVGCVAIPEETLNRFHRGEDLSSSEAEEVAVHPLIGRDLLKNIPRLEGVAEIVAYQEKRYDGGGSPRDGLSGKAIPAGGRILKAALDFDMLTSRGALAELAIAELRHRKTWYDPEVLSALQKVVNVTTAPIIREMKVHQLKDGMILAMDVTTPQGTLLCGKGQEVTRALHLRLKNWVRNIGLRDTITVFLPADGAYNADQDVCEMTAGGVGQQRVRPHSDGHSAVAGTAADANRVNEYRK